MALQRSRTSAATIAALATLALGTPNCEAVPFPTPPTDAAIASQWANPDVRHRDATSGISTAMEELADGSVQLTLQNNSGTTLSEVSVRVQRAKPVRTVAEVRAALAAEDSFYDVTTPFMQVPIDLAPGESNTVTVGVDKQALRLQADGAYPMLINVNGQLGQGGQQYLTSERWLHQVGVPRISHPPAKVGMLVPVTADTDILPGETGVAPGNPPLILQSERLAKDVAPDGRLTALLDASAGDVTCLALDPELVATIHRMADGYLVASSRPDPAEHKPRLRDSWGTKNEKIASTPGEGATDARTWLAKLRQLAQHGTCMVSTPWANTDLNAVAATGIPSLMEEALSGPEVLTQILGTPVREDIIVPGGGYVTAATANALDRGMAAPATLLVSDNTISDHSVTLGKQVRAVGYDAELSAQLATLGATPETVGYSNQWQRFDYQLDSPNSRRLTATASLALAATDDDKPLLVMPPADIEATDLQALVRELTNLRAAGLITPQSVLDYAGEQPRSTDSAPGSPFDDPTSLTDTEILRAGQQAKSLDDLTTLMVPEPTIALTPAGFTNPLRHDLLRALSINSRRSIAGYEARAGATDRILGADNDIVQKLRSSVVLLPPGNVYTRTSESSPLLFVAENGLPLPVDARIGYTAPDDAHISVAESIKIPARGSITAQMMADLPDNSQRTDLTVWLASQNGAPISHPVMIGVQTRTGLLGLGGLLALGLAGLGFVMFHVKRR